jgi:site-specific recombinase XerD
MIVSKGYSIKTLESYLKDIQQYFEIMKNNNDINGYLNILYGKGYRPSTQNRKLSALNSYYNYLLKFNYANENPFSKVSFAKLEKRLPDHLSYPEVVKILSYLKDDLLNKAIVEVLYGCGLRVSELISLKISDIHYKEQLIECKGKGNKQRYIPINKNALLAINNYKINFRDKLKNKDNETILFLNKFGHVLRREYVNVMLDKVAKKIGLNKKLHPHMFRHSFSTHLLENGANLRVIQEMLGHQNISTTEIYTHINTKKLINDYNKYFEE